MRRLYLAPKEALAALRCSGESKESDSSPGTFLVVVDFWPTDADQDRFEAFPGVQELHERDYDKPVPARLATGFADGKVATVTPLDTLESALWKIRAAWPAARH